MKKFFPLLFAAVLLSAVFCTAVSAEIPADARFEVFDLTAADADVDWYQDGIVVAIPNDGSEELSVASGDYQLRYVFILLFDKDGVCVEVGNNLLSADDERAAEFPQHDVKIPAKGFGIFFYYNANEGPSNLALYEYYEALGGTIYSNETGRAASGKNYVAVLENNTVTVYFAAADTPAESVPEESSEEPLEEDSEETPEAASEEPAVSDTPSAATSSAEASETSSEAPAVSDVASSQAEESSSSGTGVIIGIIIAVVAVAAVAVIVLVARKKKS